MQFVLRPIRFTFVMMELNSVGIIGGGIVGMATAYHLQQLNPSIKILIFEKENQLGLHQTGNNSGVIHSGIYYKPGSLKAKNCLEGYQLLLEFCREHQINFELCGKLIVATRESQFSALQTLYERGIEHGLEGLKWLESEQIREMEPHCNGLKGIYVPQTGIVNYKEVVGAIQKVLEPNNRVQIITGAEVVEFDIMQSTLMTRDKESERRVGYSSFVSSVSIKDKMNLESAGVIKILLADGQTYSVDRVVNCAGLHCDRIAELAGEKLELRIIPFRGEYYSIRTDKSHLVKNLIYPVPDANVPFLGVHFTRRISGEIEAGPNAVFAFKKEGYRKSDFSLRDFSRSLFWPGFQKVILKYWKTGLGELYRSFSKRAFTKALQELVPDIQESDLIPAGAGVRAQACDKNGNLIDDFYIKRNEHFVHVLNAPSPAATSSFSIGLSVAQMVLKS
jgi:(S)-2-hydroxyglutarate dehydrogenase